MSRARPWIHPHTGQTIWFDRQAKATAEQLEFLADVEGIDLDDLLDEGMTQRQVLARLHGHDGKIPPEVFVRRAARQLALVHENECVICSTHDLVCEGDITKHHFIPRWMMLLLDNYNAYSSRSKCCIPICLSRHRDLHLRSDKAPKSIAEYLRPDQRAFAQKMLDELREQRPAVFELILGGNPDTTYEATLIYDYIQGKFSTSDGINIAGSDQSDLDLDLSHG